MPLETSWSFVVSGIALSLFGTAALLAEPLKTAFQPVISDPPSPVGVPEPLKPDSTSFVEQLKIQFHRQMEDYETKYTLAKRSAEELRSQLEHRDQLCQQFEQQIHDLRYEIKTLLQLTEIEPKRTVGHAPSFASSDSVTTLLTVPPPKVSTPDQARQQLRRCLDIAQKLSGAFPAGADFTLSYPVLDLRRLFDSLKSETASALIVYSLKEGKVIFANPQNKALFGWNPDRFAQDFVELQGDTSAWERALAELTHLHEASTHLLMGARNGQELAVECLLGTVPTGLFRGYVLGVLYTLQSPAQ